MNEVLNLLFDGLSWGVRHPVSVVVGWYAVLSLITFVMYGIDKRAARRGLWRTSEYALHLAEFLGGWPGALLAQRFFHHKSVKVSYRIEFWIMVALNLGFLYLAHSCWTDFKTRTEARETVARESASFEASYRAITLKPKETLMPNRGRRGILAMRNPSMAAVVLSFGRGLW